MDVEKCYLNIASNIHFKNYDGVQSVPPVLQDFSNLGINDDNILDKVKIADGINFVNISNNQIGNKGVKILLEMLETKTKVFDVDLSNNQINEDIFDYIKEWVIKNDQIDYFGLYGDLIDFRKSNEMQRLLYERREKKREPIYKARKEAALLIEKIDQEISLKDIQKMFQNMDLFQLCKDIQIQFNPFYWYILKNENPSIDQYTNEFVIRLKLLYKSIRYDWARYYQENLTKDEKEWFLSKKSIFEIFPEKMELMKDGKLMIFSEEQDHVDQLNNLLKPIPDFISICLCVNHDL